MSFDDYLRRGRSVVSTRYYNGFSPDERSASGPPIQQKRYREGNDPGPCSITRHAPGPGEPRIQTHLEDYRYPTDWLPIAPSAHKLLHQRFYAPRSWFRLVGEHYVHGAWFTLLVMSPNKMLHPFTQTYPIGLPLPGDLWTDVADQWGVTRDLFFRPDVTDIVRHLWAFPEIERQAS